MSGLTWSVTPTQAFVPMTDEFIAAIRRGVRTLANRYAPQIEAWMKSNAVWIDRTGSARQTLTAVVEDLALDMVTIVLSYGVSYGIYLELAHQARFAVIAPAIDHFGPLIMADVQAMLS